VFLSVFRYSAHFSQKVSRFFIFLHPPSDDQCTIIGNSSCRIHYVEPLVSALSDLDSLPLGCFLFCVCISALTSNRRYAQTSFPTSWHYDESLNERADINEASPSPLAKSRTVHPVRGARREILVENSSPDCAFVHRFDELSTRRGFN
jgi:hypothetical protein